MAPISRDVGMQHAYGNINPAISLKPPSQVFGNRSFGKACTKITTPGVFSADPTRSASGSAPNTCRPAVF